MTPTPRTDAAWQSITVSQPWDAAADEMRQHACQLERELAAERVLADKLADNLQIIERMADDENLGSADFRKSCRYCTPKMLTAWKEARDA